MDLSMERGVEAQALTAENKRLVKGSLEVKGRAGSGTKMRGRGTEATIRGNSCLFFVLIARKY